MRQNATFFVLVGAAALLVVLSIFPFLRDYGHAWLIIPLAAFFVILFFTADTTPFRLDELGYFRWNRLMFVMQDAHGS